MAVSRHGAFSSLLSSLWGSPQSGRASGAYEFVNRPTEFFYMNIKPQPKIETATFSVTGVEKRLVDAFRQRCEEMDSSAQGFILNQLLAAFLKSKVRKPHTKRKSATA